MTGRAGFFLPKLMVGLAARRQLLILTYHRVLPEPDPLLPSEPTGEQFREQLEILLRSCTILPLADALERVGNGTLPRAAVSITFDDGYRNNYSVALPALRDYGLAATFFVATRYVNGGLMWNDRIIESIRACKAGELDMTDVGLGKHELRSDEQRIRAMSRLLSQVKYLAPPDRAAAIDAVTMRTATELPERFMLTSDEIRALRAAGMTIGAHTVNHPILAKLSEREAKEEIEASKRDLETILGERVTLFAYPNGKPGADYSPENVESVRGAGFAAAFTTAPGSVTRVTRMLELPRVAIWRSTPLRTQVNLLRAYRS